VRTLSGHAKAVSALAALAVNGRIILASGGHDQTARFWNPLTGARLGSLEQIDWVRAVCAVAVRGRVLIAIASYRTVHLWNPGTGRVLRTLDGHTRAIRALAPLRFEGRELLASAGDDNDIRIWDPATGECERRLTGHTDTVSALNQVTVAEDVLLASASHDRTARLWDLTADRRTPIPGGRSVRVDAACPVTVDHRQLVATTAADNGTVRLWDPATGAVEGTIDNRTHEINGLCGVKLDDAQLIATANRSGIVKLWDTRPSDRELLRISQEGWVRAICPVHSTDDRILLATAGYGRAVIRLWRLPSGKRIRGSLSFWSAQRLQVHARGINALQSMTLNGAVVLATAGDDWRIVLWDLKGHHLGDLWGHQGPVRALCAADVDGRPRLVSGSDDQTLRIWDPVEGTCETVLTGHTDRTNAIGPVVVDGQPMVASASHDRTVKVWDLAGRSLVLSIPVHDPALTCVQASGLLIVGPSATSGRVKRPGRNRAPTGCRGGGQPVALSATVAVRPGSLRLIVSVAVSFCPTAPCGAVTVTVMGQFCASVAARQAVSSSVHSAVPVPGGWVMLAPA
jgi:WD40 repeat protein